MCKAIIIIIFCLLLIPFNAADILLSLVGSPKNQPAGDIVIPASVKEISEPAVPQPEPLVLEPIKPFQEDPNPLPIDPQNLPKIVDKNEPKEDNPVQVPINPADFFTIVDKNEPREPSPDEAELARQAQEQQTKAAAALDLKSPEQAPDKDAPRPPDVETQPKILPPFQIIDRNEPKEPLLEPEPVMETPVAKPFVIIDKNEPREPDPNPHGPGSQIVEPKVSNTKATPESGDDGKATLTDPDGYEPDNTPDDPTYLDFTLTDQVQNHTLHTLGTQNGNTYYGGDIDWFRFWAAAGSSYHIHSDHPTSTPTSSEMNLIISLYEDDGTTYITGDSYSLDVNDFTLTFTPTVTGYYKFKVSQDNVVNYPGDNPETGSYTLHYSWWTDPDSYEPDNSTSDYTSLFDSSSPPTQAHTLHSSTDQDWYRFHLDNGQIFRCYSTGTTDTKVYLYWDNGTDLIISNDNDGDGNNFLLTLHNTSDSGYFKLKVVGYNGAIGAYDFHYYRYAPPDAYEDDDSAAACTALSPSITLQSQYHSLDGDEDQDWFRFQAIPGKAYSFEATGETDTKIYLYQDDGTTLVDSDDDDGPGLNFRLDFMTPAPPTYYKLKVVGYSGDVGLYEFWYWVWIYADSYEPDDSASDYTILGVTGNLQSQVHTIGNTTDQDWYRFYATAGANYTFYSTYYTDTQIYLFQDNGTTQIDWDEDDGELTNFYLDFSPTANGYYKLKVKGWTTNTSSIGEYVFYY